MNRKTQIIEYLKKIRPDDVEILTPLVDEVVYLESELEKLREIPLIEFNPKDKTKHRTTPGAKLYKELLQQYNNAIKTIVVKTGVDGEDEESPLRTYMKLRNERK